MCLDRQKEGINELWGHVPLKHGLEQMLLSAFDLRATLQAYGGEFTPSMGAGYALTLCVTSSPSVSPQGGKEIQPT